MVSALQHIQKLSPYKPGKSSDPGDFYRYKAILSSNENNFGPSPLAMKAIADSLQTINLYPDPQGAKLIEALAINHKRNEDEIILSNGLDGLLYSLFKAFTVSGDHVITNDNSFVAFNKFSLMNDLELDIIENKDYAFDLDKVVDAIRVNTKIIYICNPNNPTGMAVPSGVLKETLKKIPEHILVIVDEAYFEFAKAIDDDFLDTSTLRLANVLTLRTFSKLYGLAGLRVGYGIAHPDIIRALYKVKLVFNPNTLAQIGALAALKDGQHRAMTLNNNTKWMEKLKREFAKKHIRTLPSFANFICTVFPTEKEADKFFQYMDKNDILLRKLDGFGMPEGVRVSIGNEEEMKWFASVLEQY